MWPQLVFMQKLAEASLNSRIVLLSKLREYGKTGMLTRQCEVINFLLEPYVLEDVNVEMNAEILQLPKLSNMKPTQYTEALYINLLPCNFMYNENVLKLMFIEVQQR